MPNDTHPTPPTAEAEATTATLAQLVATLPRSRWRTATLRTLAAIGSDLASIRLGLEPTLLDRVLGDPR